MKTIKPKVVPRTYGARWCLKSLFHGGFFCEKTEPMCFQFNRLYQCIVTIFLFVAKLIKICLNLYIRLVVNRNSVFTLTDSQAVRQTYTLVSKVNYTTYNQEQYIIIIGSLG